MSADEVRRSTVVHGRQYVDAALAAGRGAILVTAHVSSVALATQALVLDTANATVAVEPLEPPELLDLLVRVRGSHGVAYRPLGPALFGDLTAALRRNELVCLVVDRDVGGGGVVLDFFGRPVRMPSGPALLALRTGAPIIPAFVSRRRDGRLDGHLESPLIVPRGGSRREKVAEITGLVTRRLEYHIGTFPEQWTVLQDVWKRDCLAIHRPVTTESA
jgi:KDO2-lipid IV(A) lauroyltransferase